MGEIELLCLGFTKIVIPDAPFARSLATALGRTHREAARWVRPTLTLGPARHSPLGRDDNFLKIYLSLPCYDNSLAQCGLANMRYPYPLGKSERH